MILQQIRYTTEDAWDQVGELKSAKEARKKRKGNKKTWRQKQQQMVKDFEKGGGDT